MNRSELKNKILELVAAGHNNMSIAKELNKLGQKTHKGNIWTKRKVYQTRYHYTVPRKIYPSKAKAPKMPVAKDDKYDLIEIIMAANVPKTKKIEVIRSILT